MNEVNQNKFSFLFCDFSCNVSDDMFDINLKYS